MEYRQITVGDAKAYLDMMRAIDEETDMMLLEPGERIYDVEQSERMIAAALERGDFFLVASEGGLLAGFISAERGIYRRIRHTAYIVTGIRKPYRNRGIGTEFFARLNAWAEDHGVTRLELTVRKANEAAIHLYQKSGFVIEGLRKQSMCVSGAYADEYYMAKFIPENDGA